MNNKSKVRIVVKAPGSQLPWLQLTPIMAVSKMSQLRPGVSINMVLKTDQRSGRLTTGSISEVPYPIPLTSRKTFYEGANGS